MGWKWRKRSKSRSCRCGCGGDRSVQDGRRVSRSYRRFRWRKGPPVTDRLCRAGPQVADGVGLSPGRGGHVPLSKQVCTHRRGAAVLPHIGDVSRKFRRTVGPFRRFPCRRLSVGSGFLSIPAESPPKGDSSGGGSSEWSVGEHVRDPDRSGGSPQDSRLKLTRKDRGGADGASHRCGSV